MRLQVMKVLSVLLESMPCQDMKIVLDLLKLLELKRMGGAVPSETSSQVLFLTLIKRAALIFFTEKKLQ